MARWPPPHPNPTPPTHTHTHTHRLAAADPRAHRIDRTHARRCTRWLAAAGSASSVGGDPAVVTFCNERKVRLEWHTARLQQWLADEGVPPMTPCEETDLMGCGDT
eukprot:775908-Prymnesium_polylepis.1